MNTRTRSFQMCRTSCHRNVQAMLRGGPTTDRRSRLCHVFIYSLYIQCFLRHFLWPKWAAARPTGSKSKWRSDACWTWYWTSTPPEFRPNMLRHHTCPTSRGETLRITPPVVSLVSETGGVWVQKKKWKKKVVRRSRCLTSVAWRFRGPHLTTQNTCLNWTPWLHVTGDFNTFSSC